MHEIEVLKRRMIMKHEMKCNEKIKMYKEACSTKGEPPYKRKLMAMEELA